jgi:carbon-monoxide dehydrogenase medium subunit
VRARTLPDAVAALDADSKILAGGQSLVPMLNMRLVRPARLVDINAVPGLAEIRARDDAGVTLGALARHSELIASATVRAHAPLLVEAARHVGHRAIRNRGTLGGSLAHADPAAELSAALLALDARVVSVGPGGRRTLAVDELVLGPLTTALAVDEILVEVEVPDARDAAWGFAEVARRAGDFALAGVAAVLRGARGRIAHARLVAFGADERPVRLRSAEARVLAHAGAREAAAAAAAECRPPDDVHASAAYRRHLVAVLTEQVVGQALGRLADA